MQPTGIAVGHLAVLPSLQIQACYRYLHSMQPPLSLTNVPLHGHPPHHTGHCGTQTLCSGLYHATRLLHTCASHICARARGQL